MKNKNLKIYLIVGIVFLFILSFSINGFSAEYSQKLVNTSFVSYTDDADLIEQLPIEGNNYRYYFDSGVVLPSSFIAGSYLFNGENGAYQSCYHLHQYYLDNLDNQHTFNNSYSPVPRHTFKSQFSYRVSGAGAMKNTYCITLELYENRTKVWLAENTVYGGSTWNTELHELYFYNNSLFNLTTLENLEFDIHARYGKNPEGNNRVCLKVELVFNQNQNISYYYYQIYQIGLGTTLICQLASYLPGCTHLDWYNDEYIYITYTVLKGIRLLKGSGTSTEQHLRFYEVPFFYESISITIPPPPPPPLPDGGLDDYDDYWLYEVISLKFDTNETLISGNFSVDFPLITIHSETTKFPYEKEVVAYLEYSDWWDFLVNAIILLGNTIILIVNLFLLFLQLCMYLITLAWNYIIMFLIIGLIGIFVWNFLIKNVVHLFMWIGWFFFWLWNVILLPFFTWFFENFLEIIKFIILGAITFLFSTLIWLATFGLGNYVEIFTSIYSFLNLIAEMLIDIVVLFIENIPVFLAFTFLYILLIFYTYLKYIYCKAKGYKNRAEKLYSSYKVYLIPIIVAKKLAKSIAGIIPMSIFGSGAENSNIDMGA